MTDRIAEMAARCEAATPGPWEQHRPNGECVYHPETNFNVCMTRRSYNAGFIAHAREDIPYLLEQLAEKEAELDRLREAQRWIPVTVSTPT